MHQSGEFADLDVPAGVCGVIVVIDGTGKGNCMPVAGFPTVNGLPVDGLTQSAPIDGVLPVNACSIVIAVAGTASNQCEPAHVAATQTGTGTINVSDDGLRRGRRHSGHRDRCLHRRRQHRPADRPAWYAWLWRQPADHAVWY